MVDQIKRRLEKQLVQDTLKESTSGLTSPPSWIFLTKELQIKTVVSVYRCQPGSAPHFFLKIFVFTYFDLFFTEPNKKVKKGHLKPPKISRQFSLNVMFYYHLQLSQVPLVTNGVTQQQNTTTNTAASNKIVFWGDFRSDWRS